MNNYKIIFGRLQKVGQTLGELYQAEILNNVFFCCFASIY